MPLLYVLTEYLAFSKTTFWQLYQLLNFFRKPNFIPQFLKSPLFQKKKLYIYKKKKNTKPNSPICHFHGKLVTSWEEGSKIIILSSIHSLNVCTIAIFFQKILGSLEHSHSISTNYSIWPSQNLLYHLYHTILQHSQHPNFYFPILLIKIIFLHNKIIYPSITIIYHTTHYLFFLTHSFYSTTTTNLLKPPSPHAHHHCTTHTWHHHH